MAENDTEELIERIGRLEDLYKILGVSKQASSGEITKAYRKLALKLHPDKCTVEGGDDAFTKVSNAFTVLKDVDQRANYDRFGSVGDVSHHGQGGGNPFQHGGGVPFDPEDLFREMFRDHPSFRGRGGGGGFPQGMQFSFNGVPMGGRRQQAAQPTEFKIPKLPEPLQTIFSTISAIIPSPFLALGSVIAITYIVSILIGFLFRNLFVVFALTMLPVHGQAKTFMWVVFVIAGLLGYL